jgi:toxin ParE1/3/4
MEYVVRLHERAEAELDQMYDDIALVAGPEIAGKYVGGLYELIGGLATFAERGTVREGRIPGLRVIGYRRSVSVAFVVEKDEVTILGVFRRGKNITSEILKDRI